MDEPTPAPETLERAWPEVHKERHLVLHRHLDELAADYIGHTGRTLSDTTVMELFQWSHGQCQNPTEPK